MGGIHPALAPKQCIGEDYIDYIVTGEGEETVIEMAQRLESRKGMEGVLGVGYKTNGSFQINPERPFIENLDDDRYRLNFELLDIPQYFTRRGDHQRVVAYKSSRGCPFRCSFCYNVKFHNRRWRAKSVERVIEDVHYLKERYNIDGVMFCDDLFYVNKKRALQIVEGIDVPAKTDIRLDLVDEDILPRIKERQVFDLLVGFESGSERVLKLLQKDHAVAHTKRGVKLLAKHGLKVSYSGIIGLPTETLEEVGQTIDLVLWIHEHHQDVSVTVGPYLPYPGAPLYDFAVQHGYVPPRNTKEWGAIDRWSEDLRLPWSPDDTVYRLREYMKFFNYNVPWLNKIAEFRLRHRWVGFPWDARLMQFMLYQAVSGNRLGQGIRKMHGLVRAQPAPSL